MDELLCHFLIGIPGCGKTTFAQLLINGNPNLVHLSPDQIRGDLYCDPLVQGHWSAIAAQVRREFDQAIAQGHPVIYDATNIRRRWRLDFLRDFSPVGVKWLGWLFETPVKDCIHRNQGRHRSVPTDVIIDYAQLLHQAPPNLSEGFVGVETVPLLADEGVDINQVQAQIETYSR